MPTLCMLKGLPASGKTTVARLLVSKGFKRVNKDDLRAMLDFGEYSKDNEYIIKIARDELIRLCLLWDHDVVIDDTNLNPEHEDKFRLIAKTCGAKFEVTFVDTPIDECVRRDLERENPVGEDTIRDMAKQYAERLNG